MQRIEQAILIMTFVAFCWLAMQAVHEFGHVLGAWATGAEVRHVALHPLILSRTDLGYNPHPLVVAWAGPVIGVLLPLLAFLGAKAGRLPGIYLFRFFAGFCLIANGVYIALGPVDEAGDSGLVMALGTPRWVLLLFGVATVSSGLFLWHGQGKSFGLGTKDGRVNRVAVFSSLLILLVIAGIEIIIDCR